MKNRKLFVYMRDYILLLFVIVCLVTAGLMIGDMVIHAVKPFVNPSDYLVKEDTGVLTVTQMDVFHSILDAAEAGKYYIQDYVIYLCTYDTINPVYNPLAELVGLYIETV